jgi:DNA-binding response OmpR family regulator
MAKILLVEDESDLAETIVEWLADEYHLVEVEANGEVALRRLADGQYDLVILDVMLPGVDGLNVCRALRDQGSAIPVLMLTARTSIDAKEAGLDAGADDYLTKPFQLRELSARIRALLRRPQTTPTNILQVGDVTLDRVTCVVTKAGQPIHLLPKEFALLELFMRNLGKVISIDSLLDRVWGTDSSVVPETVRTNIKTLRKKIDTPQAEASYIQTVHGQGYKMEPIQ